MLSIKIKVFQYVGVTQSLLDILDLHNQFGGTVGRPGLLVVPRMGFCDLANEMQPTGLSGGPYVEFNDAFLLVLGGAFYEYVSRNSVD